MQEVGRSSCVLSRGVGNAAKVKSAWIVAKCLGPPLGKAVQCDRWPRFALSAWKPPATADIAEKRHDQLYIYIYISSPLFFFSPPFSLSFFLLAYSVFFPPLLSFSLAERNTGENTGDKSMVLPIFRTPCFEYAHGGDGIIITKQCAWIGGKFSFFFEQRYVIRVSRIVNKREKRKGRVENKIYTWMKFITVERVALCISDEVGHDSFERYLRRPFLSFQVR